VVEEPATRCHHRQRWRNADCEKVDSDGTIQKVGVQHCLRAVSNGSEEKRWCTRNLFNDGGHVAR
jgi:hypothetical protein